MNTPDYTLHHLHNEHIFCEFIDIKKAFDSVDRYFPLYEFGNMGIPSKFYHSVKAMYQISNSCDQFRFYPLVTTEDREVVSMLNVGNCLWITLTRIYFLGYIFD